MNRGRGGFRGGRGASRGGFSSGPPDTVVEMGEFVQPCEGEMVKGFNNKQGLQINQHENPLL